MVEKQKHSIFKVERRAYKRVPLDAPVMVKVRVAGGEEVSAMLVDCGRGGVQLALPPGTNESQSVLGARLELTGLPKAFQGLGGELAGHVTWVSNDRCGIRFDQPLPLTDMELIELAAEL